MSASATTPRAPLDGQRRLRSHPRRRVAGALGQRHRRRAGRGQDALRAPDAVPPGAPGKEGPLPDDAVRAVAEARQLHAAVLVLRRAPDRERAGGHRRPRLGDPTQGRRGDAGRDHRPRRAGGARGRGHRQLQGAPGCPRRRRGACGRSSTISRSTSSSWGAASLLVGEYTRGGDRELLGVRHRRRHHPALQPPPRAARDPRGRGVEASRGQLRDRRSFLRDRAATGSRSSRACAARTARSPSRRGSTSASRPASPGSTRCSAAACRGRARRWSRAGRGRARRCSACNSCSRARGRESRASTSRSRRRANQLRRIAQGLGWDLRPLEERGLLTFRYVSPVELSTDRFLD